MFTGELGGMWKGHPFRQYLTAEENLLCTGELQLLGLTGNSDVGGEQVTSTQSGSPGLALGATALTRAATMGTTGLRLWLWLEVGRRAGRDAFLTPNPFLLIKGNYVN